MNDQYTFDKDKIISQSSADHGALANRLGIEITKLEADESVAIMPVAGNTQPLCLLNGGASAALAETLGSRSANVHANSLGKVAVGVELNITHHRSTSQGHVQAVAKALHLGRTLATYHIQILTVSPLAKTEEKLLATARLTCVLIDKRNETQKDNHESDN